MISLADVARSLNVSPASVSRALNGRPGISEATRSRILAEVKRLNYAPNEAARALASSRTENIGFAVYHAPNPIASDPFYSRIMLGVEQELRHRNFHLLLSTLEDEHIARPKQWNIVRGRRVDGLILVGPFIPSRFILDVYTQGLPLVLVDNALPDAPIDNILADDRAGAYMAADHILQHGHQRVAILSGPTTWFTSIERCSGYKDALRDAGIEPVCMLHAEATTYESGYQLMQQALQHEPTAVLAVNDAMALGAVDAARAAGRAVPDALAITGFDDIEAAGRFDVALTTIHIPKRDLGRVAARRLLERIAEPTAPRQRILLTTTLIVRRSCGCTPTTKGGDGIT